MARRFLLAVCTLLAGTAVTLMSCHGTCDYDLESPGQGFVVWSAKRADGTRIAAGCAVAHPAPGVYGDVGQGISVPSFGDVIRFSAAPGDMVTLSIRDWVGSVQYRGQCGPTPPTTDLTDSALFCGTNVSARQGILNSCETAASSTEPADIVSNVLGDSSSGLASVITLRVRGVGPVNVISHKGSIDTTTSMQTCASAPNTSIPVYPLFTILAP